MKTKALGIDLFNHFTPVLFGHGDGKTCPQSEDCRISDYTGRVLLPMLSQQRAVTVSSENPCRWNSGMNLSHDAKFNGNCARVPAWALMEMLKKDEHGLAWKYQRSARQSHSISIQEIIRTLFCRLQSDSRSSEQGLTIVTIPEQTSSWGQETMLRSMTNRNNTRLLWRSIAAVLGLDKIATLHDGSRIAVLDLQPHEATLTILEMRLDSQNGVEMLVPVRHLPKPPYYFSTAIPPLDFYHAEALLGDNNIIRNAETLWFLSQVMDSSNNLNSRSVPVFDGRTWKCINKLKISSFLDDSQRYAREKPSWIKPVKELLAAGGCSSDAYNSAMTPGEIYDFIRSNSEVQFDHILCCGPYLKFLDQKKLKSCFHGKEIIIAQEDLIVSGAVVFGIRAQLRLPTYFDQMPQLDIVVQDTENEEIKTDVMIQGGVVRGNEEYKPKKPLTGYSIDKDETWCEFYLQMEDARNLRFLKQDFQVKLGRRYDISLWPSMRPAQGMGRVEVKAEIFPEDVLLDWEKMELSDETIDSLNQKIERSFPPYIPGVKADDEVWIFRECEYYISWYTSNGTKIKDVAKILGSIGLDHNENTGLGRINVFGNHPDFRVSTEASPNLIRDFLNQLLKDYASEENYGDVIRTIAWTYASEKFTDVRKDMLRKLGTNNSMMLQEQTACANLFCTPKEYKAYFGRVLREFETGNEAMNGYVNCLKKLFSYKNDALNYIDSDDCRKMMRHLLKMLDRGFQNNQPLIFKNALTAMLFMLKRRRYDRSFMKYKGETELEPLLANIIKKINGVIEICNRDMFKQRLVMTTDGNTNLAAEILKFMQGKGTLSGFVSMNNE